MKREQAAEVQPEKSEPNTVSLSDGSYIKWDHDGRMFRVAYYERRTAKGSDMEMTIAVAMKKPVHNSKVKDIFGYISQTEEYDEISS